MSTTTDTIRNGVDTEKLFATLDLLKAAAGARALPVPRHQPLDRRAPTTARRSRASSAPAPRTRPATEASSSTPASPRSCSAPTPGANPAEYLLHALAACLTTSIVYVAAARKVELTSVESS